MLIHCPCCGPRESGEFAYHGDAAPRRPDPASLAPEVALAEMTDYVYLRTNPRGRHAELWYHGLGCRSWLVVTRDTFTHAIEAVSFARDVAAARAAGTMETAS